VAGVLGEPQAAVGGGDDPGRSPTERERKLLEAVMARRRTVGPRWNQNRDLVGGVFGEPDGPVGGGRDTCRAAFGRGHEVVVRLGVVGKDAADAAALRIGEPYRSVARYGQSFGKAVEVKAYLPERAAGFHQSQHRSAVFGEPDARGPGRDSVWSVNPEAARRRMRKGGRAGGAAGLDPIAKLVHRGLRRRRTAAGGAERE